MDLWVVEVDGAGYVFLLEAAAMTVAEAYETHAMPASWVDCLDGYAEVLAAVA